MWVLPAHNTLVCRNKDAGMASVLLTLWNQYSFTLFLYALCITRTFELWIQINHWSFGAYLCFNYSRCEWSVFSLCCSSCLHCVLSVIVLHKSRVVTSSHAEDTLSQLSKMQLFPEFGAGIVSFKRPAADWIGGSWPASPGNPKRKREGSERLAFSRPAEDREQGRGALGQHHYSPQDWPKPGPGPGQELRVFVESLFPWEKRYGVAEEGPDLHGDAAPLLFFHSGALAHREECLPQSQVLKSCFIHFNQNFHLQHVFLMFSWLL